ncbi:MAG TPA: DUF2721 domain-containing protein [Opitutaceae bacterium]|nr:DUF2721 domain-containing protein [Opitutaceae bacterium]
MNTTSSFVSIIQLAISPVILVAGIATFLVMLTNRLGRIIDITRKFADQIPTATRDDREHLAQQLTILWSRAQRMRLTITFAGLSAFLQCLLVIVIFLDAWIRREFAVEMVTLFILSVVCLLTALAGFIQDIWVSLQALEHHVERALSEGKEL